MNTPVSFEIAKLLKEKGFEGECSSFYVKPNSKVFGIDEHGRTFSVTYTPKKLYHCGEHAALNKKSVYLAPTIADVIMWLHEKHGIWIFAECDCYGEAWYPKISIASKKIWNNLELRSKFLLSHRYYNESRTPTEAYLLGITYTLTHLI